MKEKCLQKNMTKNFLYFTLSCIKLLRLQIMSGKISKDYMRFKQGAFVLRQVRGEVDPADLFAKHLPSAGRLGQLVQRLRE